MGAKHRRAARPEPFQPRVSRMTYAVASTIDGFYLSQPVVDWWIVRDYLRRSRVRVPGVTR